MLDNFEHLLDGATLVAALLQHALHIQIIVTSRVRLNLSGEMVYPLGGLPVPEAEHDVLAYDAAKLLLQRALRVRPELEVQPQDRPSWWS